MEGLRAVHISKQEEAEAVWAQNAVPVLIDPKGESIRTLKPDVVVDAILAKKNLGTTREMASLTIALGPGFTAGQDVDVVVETKRGHKLGRIIREGAATPNTGVPGVIGGAMPPSGCSIRRHRVFSATCTPSVILSRPGRPLPKWKHRQAKKCL